MRLSPLRLKRYFFPLSHIEANPAYAPDAGNQFEIDTRLTTHVDVKQGIYAAQLVVTLSKDKEANLKSPYFFQIAAYAAFEPGEDVQMDSLIDDEIKEAVTTEGFKILAGATREHLATLTARGPWGEQILPVLRLRIAAD